MVRAGFSQEGLQGGCGPKDGSGWHWAQLGATARVWLAGGVLVLGSWVKVTEQAFQNILPLIYLVIYLQY